MTSRDETVAGLAEVLAGHPIGSGYYGTTVGIDEAREMAAAALAHLEAQGWAQVTREQVVVEADAYRDDAGNMPIPRRIGPFPSTRAAEEYMRTLAPLYGSWNTAPIFKPAEDADG